MKNRQFGILLAVIISGFCILYYQNSKNYDNLEYKQGYRAIEIHDSIKIIKNKLDELLKISKIINTNTI